jgi:hypothetical protein
MTQVESGVGPTCSCGLGQLSAVRWARVGSARRWGMATGEQGRKMAGPRLGCAGIRMTLLSAKQTELWAVGWGD